MLGSGKKKRNYSVCVFAWVWMGGWVVGEGRHCCGCGHLFAALEATLTAFSGAVIAAEATTREGQRQTRGRTLFLSRSTHGPPTSLHLAQACVGCHGPRATDMPDTNTRERGKYTRRKREENKQKQNKEANNRGRGIVFVLFRQTLQLLNTNTTFGKHGNAFGEGNASTVGQRAGPS